ncbi:hypothetical protein LMZ02_15655 [Paenibacillus macerans]|uniref:hypothetical protein n=1 Tax=Paenibacillus macerans TaxID=44252 RepID=UPI001E3F4192|nr:hypothetical protein [Paenibacillus macerans]UMV50693.1 hypothetical protein LMZ02_15655 [Paenibacillus macerans]
MWPSNGQGRELDTPEAERSRSENRGGSEGTGGQDRSAGTVTAGTAGPGASEETGPAGAKRPLAFGGLGRWAVASAAAAVIFLGVLAMLLWGSRFLLPHAYAYVETTADNGVKLHALTVSPEQIELRAADRPLGDYRVYGINGGFFYNDAVLSIAVSDDRPVQGAAGEYGSGWFNAKYARGTLVWDAAAGRFSVQVVSAADELNVTDRGRYFAQGGVSMKLQDDAGWRAAAVDAEHLPYPDEERLRSGLVYDDAGRLWLIVTPTRCTAETFRTAVKEKIAPGSAVDGIFLDGDGSSQLNAAEAKLHGDSRDLRQIIAIQ